MADATGRLTDSADRISFRSVSSKEDSQVFVAAPDYRVFLWGIDITADVFSVSVENAMNDEINTMRISVANDGEKWIIPPGVALTDQPFAEDNLNDAWDGFSQQSPNSDGRSFLSVFMQQKIERFRKRGSLYLNGFNTVVDSLAHGPTYPMVPGMPALQATDPIRVFFRNPWILQSTGVDTNSGSIFPNDVWYFAFTGFVATVTEQYDASSNRSILSLYCEEIRRLLRYMQTTTNPDIIDQSTLQGAVLLENTPNNVAAQQQSSPIFARDENQTSSIISGNTVIQALEKMLFGNAGSTGQGKIEGIHGFDKSREVVMEASSDNVEQQTSLQLDTMYPALSYDDMIVAGSDYLFDNKTLYILLPDPAGFPNRIWPYQFQVNATQFSEMRNRFDILDEFITSLDSLWYSTPKGDIVLEFPQYDMSPFKYSSPWKNILQIQNEWSGFSLSDDDRAVKTLALGKGSAIRDQNVKSILFDAAAVSDVGMQARYGLRILPFDKPFYFSSEDQPGGIKALAAMRLNLANADSNRLEGLECLPNFRAPLARPFWFKYRNIIGFLTRVTHRIIWGQSAQTVYMLEHLRHFDAGRRDWVRLSDGYGWSWKKPSQLDNPNTGNPPVLPAPPPEVPNQNINLSIDTSKFDPGQVQEINDILGQLNNANLPPDRLQTLRDRLSIILATGSIL